MASVHWTVRLFGQKLIKCRAKNAETETVEHLQNTFNILGVYFSFANINAQKEETTSLLLNLYERLNSKTDGMKKPIEIVQIVLWANNDIFGDFETSHKDCIVNMPWLAVPYTETEIKTKLSRRFRIKTGVPTLILLDDQGIIITVSGRERLVEDPNGELFPWKPRPIQDVLRDVELIPGGLYENKSKNVRFYRDLPKNSIKALYFSANWCPPCRAFTPQLIETYKQVRKKDPNFEIIFVSSDRSPDSFEVYLRQMPWLAVPFDLGPCRKELAEIYGVRGIPTVLILDGDDGVVVQDARTEIQDDPTALNYPWPKRLVNILNERFAAKLYEMPAIILFIDEEIGVKLGEALLQTAAVKYNKNNNSTEDEDMEFLIGEDSEISDTIKDLIGSGLEDVVPLLICLDLPQQRFAMMDSGEEISNETIVDFVDKYQNNQLVFQQIIQL